MIDVQSRVRKLDARDVPACLALAETAGWPREPEKWDVLLATGEGFAVDEGGTLAAMVVLPRFRGITFIAMMVVHPERKRRGLGRRLLEHAMTTCDGPFALYATEEGKFLYETIGFRSDLLVDKWIGTPSDRAGTTSHRTLSVREVSAERDLVQRIVERDAIAFGFGRDALLQNLAARASRLVVDDDGGFAIRWWNGHLDVIGPIVAASEARAVELFHAAREGAHGKLRIDVLRSSSLVAAEARRIGLAHFGEAPRMVHPVSFIPPAPSGYHAIALQAFG